MVLTPCLHAAALSSLLGLRGLRAVRGVGPAEVLVNSTGSKGPHVSGEASPLAAFSFSLWPQRRRAAQRGCGGRGGGPAVAAADVE